MITTDSMIFMASTRQEIHISLFSKIRVSTVEIIVFFFVFQGDFDKTTVKEELDIEIADFDIHNKLEGM